LNIRRKERNINLHKVAQAIAYSRSEGVIYYSDYIKRIDELKSQSYNTKHTLIKLDDTIADIKKIGKLIVTYQKYLPIKKELDNLKFAKFTRQKFENKHQLELASFAYADEQLKEKGFDPERVNKDDLISKIKNNEKVIKELEMQADKIFERIEKLNTAQSIVDEFVSDRDSIIQQTRNSQIKKSTEIEL
jgi:formate dehydrogenase assembly factor FdhD